MQAPAPCTADIEYYGAIGGLVRFAIAQQAYRHKGTLEM